ncbi:hypothetical protein CTAYLR_010378 [Chrysophaeum taylorii]|uniref:HAT C-terminal dimerisation domain-containing protein n=1 Tax=Chrysophaeum taylorii TaxID=2483200 RepID=A0AAD7XNS3_9STRA|nr:hypothetical protein CTAYLR_010378 [Chrysophaeum taylorii]
MISSIARALHSNIKSDLAIAKKYLGSRFVGLQVDFWTDNQQNSHGCLTATWIDPQTRRRRLAALATTTFPNAFKKDGNIDARVTGVLAQFDLTYEVCILFTADGGERSLLMNKAICPWLVCVCHNMKRCVVKALGFEHQDGTLGFEDETPEPEANTFLRKIRGLVTFIKNSPRQLKLLSQHPVMVVAHDAGELQRLHHRGPSRCDPAKSFVKTLEDRKYSTLNKILPLIRRVDSGYETGYLFRVMADPTHHTGGTDDDNEDDLFVEETTSDMGKFSPDVIATMRSEIKDRFSLDPADHRFAQWSSEVPEILVLALIFDPTVELRRYETLSATFWKFNAVSVTMAPEKKTNILKNAKEQVEKMLQFQYENAKKNEPTLRRHLLEANEEGRRRSSVDGGAPKDATRRRVNLDSDSVKKDQLPKGEDQILAFWALREGKMPLTFRVVCKILAASASEAMVERTFSALTHIFLNFLNRDNMGEDTRDSVVFATLNLNQMKRAQPAQDVRQDLHPDEYAEALAQLERASESEETFAMTGGESRKKRRLDVSYWFEQGFQDGDLLEGADGNLAPDPVEEKKREPWLPLKKELCFKYARLVCLPALSSSRVSSCPTAPFRASLLPFARLLCCCTFHLPAALPRRPSLLYSASLASLVVNPPACLAIPCLSSAPAA